MEEKIARRFYDRFNKIPSSPVRDGFEERFLPPNYDEDPTCGLPDPIDIEEQTEHQYQPTSTPQ